MPDVVTFGEAMVRLAPPAPPPPRADANPRRDRRRRGTRRRRRRRPAGPLSPRGSRASPTTRWAGSSPTTRARPASRRTHCVWTGRGPRRSVLLRDRCRPAPRRASSTTAKIPPSPPSGPARSTGRSILAGAKWFHTTGITPALGAKVRPICVRAALAAARAAGRGDEHRPELSRQALERRRGGPVPRPASSACATTS